MSIQLAGYSVIITARQFNPSIFNLLWLVKNELVREDEILPSWVFTEPLVQINNAKFAMVVVPEQLQFFPLGSNDSSEDANVQQTIAEKIDKVVSRLPHTPYTAIGLNFVWHVVPDEEIRAATRRLFFWPESPFFKQFATDDARFGGYASIDAFGCRLRVDAKPAIAGDGSELIQFSFNYHKDLTTCANPGEAISELLSHWSEAKAAALQIVESL